MGNLTRVVNSATEQMEEQRKSLFAQKSGKKLERELSDAKKDIYKDLSKTVERYRHLPKLKINGSNQFNSRDHGREQSRNLDSYEPVNQTIDLDTRGNHFNVRSILSTEYEEKFKLKRQGLLNKKNWKPNPFQQGIHRYS